jgi:hypothetical protein
VLRFDVHHASVVRDGGEEKAVERGIVGLKSFSARLGDRAKVSVVLSRPAYGYLIAYAAHDKEYLLDPAGSLDSDPQESANAVLPARTEKLQYPPVGKRVEYALDDGVGLHVFLAVVSDKPLPSYAEWRKKYGQAPWVKTPPRLGAVWRKVGGDLHAAVEANPDVRGPGAEEWGAAPVEKLVDWWRKQPGITDVALTGFAVTKAE